MTNGNGNHSTHGLRRAHGARTLRDTLNAAATAASQRRERFQFPCLKRLTLPRQDFSRFAPNI
jgi:hypothetical protein